MTVRHAAHHLLRSAAGFPRTTRHASRQTQLPSFFRRDDSRCIVSVCKKYLRPPPTTQLQAQQQHPNSLLPILSLAASSSFNPKQFLRAVYWHEPTTAKHATR